MSQSVYETSELFKSYDMVDSVDKLEHCIIRQIKYFTRCNHHHLIIFIEEEALIKIIT